MDADPAEQVAIPLGVMSYLAAARQLGEPVDPLRSL